MNYNEANSIQNLRDNINNHSYFLRPTSVEQQLSVNVFDLELLSMGIGLKTFVGFRHCFPFAGYAFCRGRERLKSTITLLLGPGY